MLEMTDQLWQTLDVGTIITIFSIIFYGGKILVKYFKNIQDNFDHIKDEVCNIHNKLDNTKLSLLHNDIKLLIDTNGEETEIWKLYDEYKALKGNGYITHIIDAYVESKKEEGK